MNEGEKDTDAAVREVLGPPPPLPSPLSLPSPFSPLLLSLPLSFSLPLPSLPCIVAAMCLSSDCVYKVYEEVGLDIRTLIREDDYIEIQQRNGQSARMFIIPGIDDCTEYTPRCRNEIKVCSVNLISLLSFSH